MAGIRIQIGLTQKLLLKTILSLSISWPSEPQLHPPYLGTWAFRWHRCPGVQRDPGVHRSQIQRSHCPHRRLRVVSRDLLWSWGLHRSLDSREKGRDNHGTGLAGETRDGETRRLRGRDGAACEMGGSGKHLGVRPTLPLSPMLTRAAAALLFQAPGLQAQVSQLLAQVPDKPRQGLLKA